MRLLYFDMTAGISGDMTLGALVHLGFPLDLLRAEVEKLPIEPVEITSRRVERNGIDAIKIDVKPAAPGLVRTYANIRKLLEESDLADPVRARASKIFMELAEAEGRVHGKPTDQVHFHELGAADSIVDIVGVSLAIEHLHIDTLAASPVPLGTGMVRTRHGVMPVPVPAVVEILRSVPVYSSGIPTEIVTPTGAAILKSCVDEFGPLPPMVVESVGYGAGDKELEIPNLLRVLVGEAAAAATPRERMLLISTNIDDMNPELYEYVMEKLMAAGAADVWLTPIQMKKTRPGTMLQVLSSPAAAETLKRIIFEETNTLGLRTTELFKESLQREFLDVTISHGLVKVKIGRLGGRVVNIAPEYRDCQELARSSGAPLKEVYDLAIAAARSLLAERGERDTDEAG